MTTPYHRERFHAINAVAAASILARRLQDSLVKNPAVNKPDASPVTIADFAVQALIVSRLHRDFPNDRFIAEETTGALREDDQLLATVADALDMPVADVLTTIDLCGHQGGDGVRTWILDPIDGTRGFIAMRQYCIALGLIDNGKARVGVLGCPNLEDGEGQTGCLFHAEEGKGTWQMSEKGVAHLVLGAELKGKQCVVANVTDPREAVFSESVESAHFSGV